MAETDRKDDGADGEFVGEAPQAPTKVLLPSEVPAVLMKSLHRRLALMQHLEATIAKGIQANDFNAHDCVTALQALSSSTASMLRLYAFFEPHAADAGAVDRKSSTAAAQAAAEKLRDSLAREEQAKANRYQARRSATDVKPLPAPKLQQ